MNLLDIVHRTPQPAPWSEGDNIPWNEPGFSERMLEVHLTQENDLASRRLELIDRHVGWIHTRLLHEKPARILDLGCGPGLYSQRLAKQGHACTGVDFSPASIAYARRTCEREGLSCAFILGDLRQADFGAPGSYDLAMQIYGEMNVFRPADVRLILGKVRQALKPGGLLLLEVSTPDSIYRMGTEGRSWWSAESGLFSDRPHIVLQENFWDEAARAATTRFHVIDAQTGETGHIASTLQAYTQDEYERTICDCGFHDVIFNPSLAPEAGQTPGEFYAIQAVS